MKKIIPVLTLCVAAIVLTTSVIGIITVSITVSVRQLIMVSVPTAIIGLSLSALCAPLAFYFKRDILCFIAFWIDLAAFILSAISVTIWLAVL